MDGTFRALSRDAAQFRKREPSLKAIFDRDYYLRRYPDVANARIDPLTHFMTMGWAEGRSPCALFDTEHYLERNPDVAHAGQNPLLHYITFGASERRACSQLFDVGWYLGKNPDVAAAGVNPLAHYLAIGWKEGREANPLFDQAWYLKRYPHVEKEGLCPLAHYAEHGLEQRLSPHPLFDGAYYLDKYPDVAEAGLNPLVHFLLRGHEEIRQSHPSFDAEWYLAENPDVAEAGINPLLHYIWEGKKEGRKPNPSEGGPALTSNPHKRTNAENAARVANGSATPRQLIESQFDARFYAVTNPDLDPAIDLLDHFLTTGWKELRDPSPSFSVEFYLAANPDVRRSGMNPFVHYCTTGKLEGRATTASATRPSKNYQASSTSVTGVLAMVKNEADIIDAFAKHMLALFDFVVMIDHGSTDGTREYLGSLASRFPQLSLYELKVPGYIQALTVNFMVEHCPALQDVDWVFVLDADEFLPFENRTAFHAALKRHANAPVIAMPWRNIMPTQYWDGRAELTRDTAIWWTPSPSPYKKVAFQRKFLRGKNFWIDQGNHALLTQRGGNPIPAADAGFDVMHLPVRSEQQLSLKLRQGVRAYEQLGETRDRTLGAHWFRLLEAVDGRSLTSELLNGIALRYGEDTPLQPISTDVLIRSGAMQRPLGSAFATLDVSPPQAQKNGAATAPHNMIEPLNDPPEAVGEDNRAPIEHLRFLGNEIHASGSPTAFRYCTLPKDRGEPDAHPTSDLEFLADFIRPSYWDIAHLTPSAWTGHVPFMFCLATLLRPRRFAELGTHFGASFFAYCQAAKRGSIPTEAIAIDCWEGDEHAGFYDDSVFDQFNFTLKHYRGIGAYLRMYFSDAAKLFDAGSLDLLHIDGLHTYEAVREDYETWRPKMSDRGVIIFHDINVHERGFGVWRLWKEIRERHPSMEFLHSHGLGVAYVGTPRNSSIERLIQLAAHSSEARDFIQHHFEEIGQKSTELFTKRWDLKQREAQLQAVGQAAEEISKLQQEIAAMKRENSDLRKLIRAPV